MHSHWRSLSVAVGILLCAVPSVASIDGDIFYEVFRRGDPVTDQSAGAPGSHSYLVGNKDGVSDTDFAEKVAKPALARQARLYLVFNQCFSGGMIDELAALGGTQFLFSAARHSETAAYGSPAPSGVDLDSTDTFNIALADGRVPAQAVAEKAVALNPFGPNPNAKRISEVMGQEHAQYHVSGGGELLKPAEYADRGIAVLWAGMPAERDGVQMKLMVDRLVAMGFQPDRIWLLYGGGTVAASHVIARAHLAGRDHPIHLQAATPANLYALINSSFGQQTASAPNFVFLYVGDHGGLNKLAVAKTGFTPDPLVTPNLRIRKGMRIYGDGK